LSASRGDLQGSGSDQARPPRQGQCDGGPTPSCQLGREGAVRNQTSAIQVDQREADEAAAQARRDGGARRRSSRRRLISATPRTPLSQSTVGSDTERFTKGNLVQPPRDAGKRSQPGPRLRYLQVSQRNLLDYYRRRAADSARTRMSTSASSCPMAASISSRTEQLPRRPSHPPTYTWRCGDSADPGAC